MGLWKKSRLPFKLRRTKYMERVGSEVKAAAICCYYGKLPDAATESTCLIGLTLPRKVCRLRQQNPSPATFSNDLSVAVNYMKAKVMKHDYIIYEVDRNIVEVPVIIFGTEDSYTTFRRFPSNKENYPLANFMGVDNHNESFLGASALIFSESIANFE